MCFLGGLDARMQARTSVLTPSGAVFLYVLHGVSFETLMAVPGMRQLTARGGGGLMTTAVTTDDSANARYVVLLNGGQNVTTRKGSPLLLDVLEGRFLNCQTDSLPSPGHLDCFSPRQLRESFTLFDLRKEPGAEMLRSVALDARHKLDSVQSRVLVLIVSPSPSGEMDRAGDKVTPIVAAWRSVAPTAQRALKSDTTRQVGLVANVDVAPTVLRFLRMPIPAEMEGRPVGVSDSPPPFALHRLHLEQRRIRLPIQLAEIAFVAVLGFVGFGSLIVLARRRRLSRPVNKATQFLALCGLGLPVTVLAGGLLPRLTYAVVVPFLLVTVVALAGLSLTARSRGVMGPVTFLGAVGLGFILLDGVLGGRAFRVPLMGGTMFDGVRFYGLPNGFIAVPLAGALFIAVGLEAFVGFLLLLSVGLFVGFPGLGANVGAAITLFTAAGLWWVVRTRDRIGIREIAFVGGVVALGLATVLLANRYLIDVPTHAGRFVAQTHGWRDAISQVWHRLGIGVGQLNAVPAAYLPTLGLFVIVWLVRVRPRPLDRGLALAGERWAHAIAVLSVSSIVAFFVNDTGVAAAAPGFLFAAAGLAYPAFVASAGIVENV